MCIASSGGLDGWAINIPTLRPPSKCTRPSRIYWLSCILWRGFSVLLLDWSLPCRLLLLGVIWLPFNWCSSSSGVALRGNWARAVHWLMMVLSHRGGIAPHRAVVAWGY